MVNVKSHVRKTKKGQSRVTAHVRALPPLWQKTSSGLTRNRRDFMVMTKTQSENFGTAGGSLQAVMDVSFDEILSVFGERTYRQVDLGKGNKTDAEWNVVLDDGTQFSIYNYKDGKNYLGAEGLPVDEIRDWHIGTRSADKNKVVMFLKKKGFNVE